MNFREGIRRLALLAGCFGVIGGAFGSYLELKPANKQKASHDRFERLAASDVVQKERKCRLLGYESGCSQIELPPNATLVAPKSKYTIEDAPKKNADPYAATAEPKGWEPVPQQKDDFADIAKPLPSNIPKKFNLEYAVPIASEINTDEIKTINWGMGKNYDIESLEIEDGTTIYPTALPSRWIYLFAVILPVIGFALPWGLIRSVQWVATGFLVNQQ
jgi:hypothetical protein